MTVYDGTFKREARQETVINLYREITGKASIPEGRQHWTLCGPMTRSGVLARSCELRHVLEERLIVPSQFHGVELKASIQESNREASGREFKIGRGPNLIIGNIAEEMTKALRKGSLKPEIVNLDTESEPPRAMALLDSVIATLNHVAGPTMVVWNTVVKSPYNSKKYAFSQISDMLKRNMSFQRACDVGKWKSHDRVFKYDGYGLGSNSIMGTIVFFRRG